MTGSAEPASGRTRPQTLLDGRWRAEREGRQEEALPDGQVTASCSAPLGRGGLGRNLKEIVDALERRGGAPTLISGAEAHTGRSTGRGDLRARSLVAAAAPLARRSAAWRAWRMFAAFDTRAAGRLGRAQHLIAFNGQALRQFRAARAAGYSSVSLMSATAHLARVVRQHALAHRRYPIESTWATHLLARSLREYAAADRIYVASRYTLESFLAEGIPAERLSLFPLTPDARFTPEPVAGESATFDVTYVGGLSVAKGTPLLVEAFRRLSHPDMRLVLVGGAGTRGMRRFLEEASARDPRIAVRPGDPLPHLRASRLYVHPAYTDGFGYAPAEALACGVPVIASDETGMKELIASPRDGLILPTGDLDALTEAIDGAYRREILGG